MPAFEEYARCLYAEILKLKRTPALMISIVTPLIPVMLFFSIAWRRGDHFMGKADAWWWLVGNSLTLWIGMLMPLTIALVTALLSDLEVRGKQWKHLFALPVRRSAIYVGKQLTTAGLLTFSTTLLFVVAWGAGQVLHLRNASLGFGEPFPFALSLRFLVVIQTAAMLLVVIHTWMSMRWKSFVPGLSVGFLGLSVAGLLKSQELWPWFPWRVTFDILGGIEKGEIVWVAPLATLLAAVPLSLLGAWDNTRRDVL